ncbi:TPA: hypothetical protein DIC20_02995 [Candidatus Dependentiae bacterium]|nr:MAG: hypothetical protein US03_C0014G0015 [candidate division TM6 bacterium GW2011_GWF2_36_131]KKQ02531.1 MAG: hypothetical protein US13_C0015G0015 [candidate division TM6 bacterium GW2011_GWE2_36_25]KKQ19277.1 MAG: hypothetical protein US32_C0012G0015 [candidate division TM6 bacterium GW2011_GWA2_36_9]HBR70114.1 hypothetical protein [Candidatus Dependentiae bacterium]HCU00642.1 hypothetical protein [Candidatus Dependentiae bacterium]
MIALHCQIMNVFPLFIWQILLIIFLWFVAFAFFLKRWLIMIITSLLTVIAGLMLAWYYYAHSLCWITVAKQVSLYAGPSKQYHAVGELPPKMICFIEKQHGKWVCVKAEKIKGWLPVP